MLMCTFGKCFVMQATKKMRGYVFPPWCHGGVAKRRREAAIAVQAATSWRLKHCGIQHLNRFRGGTNAFYSVKTAVAVEHVATHFTAEDKPDDQPHSRRSLPHR